MLVMRVLMLVYCCGDGVEGAMVVMMAGVRLVVVLIVMDVTGGRLVMMMVVMIVVWTVTWCTVT